MTEEELLVLIKQGEGQQLELKSSLGEMKQVIETLCAFVHADGGTVLVGVTDDKQICGVDLGKKGEDDFANAVRQNTRPPLAPSLVPVEIGGKVVFVVHIEPKQDSKLYQAYGKSFVRVGKTNQVMSPEEIQSRLLGSPVESVLRQKGLSFDVTGHGRNQFARDVATVLRRQFTVPSELGVKFGHIPDESFDVIALVGSKLCYIECLQGLSDVTDDKAEGFVRRLDIVGADITIYLVNTDGDLAPVVNKLGTLFQPDSTRDDRGSPKGLTCMVSASHIGYLFVSNTKPNVAAKLGSCFWYAGKPVGTTPFPPIV